jgi:hypothetical protein
MWMAYRKGNLRVLGESRTEFFEKNPLAKFEGLGVE